MKFCDFFFKIRLAVKDKGQRKNNLILLKKKIVFNNFANYTFKPFPTTLIVL